MDVMTRNSGNGNNHQNANAQIDGIISASQMADPAERARLLEAAPVLGMRCQPRRCTGSSARCYVSDEKRMRVSRNFDGGNMLC